jgi:regulator of protease activity HflC (stomatin/prohibitin superfamily)
MLKSAEGKPFPHDAVEALTLDGQEVLVGITIFFRIDPEQVNVIRTRWGKDYLPNFIRPTARGIVRDVVSEYPADTIWNVGRLDFEADIAERLTASFAEEGFILVDVLIRDLTFSESYVATLDQYPCGAAGGAQRNSRLYRHRRIPDPDGSRADDPHANPLEIGATHVEDAE